MDIDIDDSAALQFAESILPKTDCVFGHHSKPKSHWIYQAAGVGRKEAFVVSGETIIELRGNRHLTVFPGSTHPSGEIIEFDQPGDPGSADWIDLQNAIRKIAIATVLSKSWILGSRHVLTLSASGFLSQLGWTENEVRDLIRLVAAQANDEEVFDRLNSVKTTYEALLRGKPTSGRGELTQLLNEDSAH